MKYPSDKLQAINDFVYSENSLVQKAKRYDDDIKYLLDLLHSERRRHAACEEDMMVYSPANISKITRLELLDNIVEAVSKNYNRNPFTERVGDQSFQDEIDFMETDPTSEIRLLGEIFSLLYKHFNRPSAC